MKGIHLLLTSAFVLASAALSSAATLNERVSEAIDILAERQGSTHPIPQALLDHARGVAIVKITKAGLVFGGAGGQGVVLQRNGLAWSAPSAFNLSGGSFGAQIGFETRRFIIVLNSDNALHLFAGEGKTKWDATAAGTAGNDRLSESQSDWQNLPLVVFQDSDGVFGGATFGGTAIDVGREANRDAYGPGVFVRDILGGKVKSGPRSQRLEGLLSGHR